MFQWRKFIVIIMFSLIDTPIFIPNSKILIRYCIRDNFFCFNFLWLQFHLMFSSIQLYRPTKHRITSKLNCLGYSKFRFLKVPRVPQTPFL